MVTTLIAILFLVSHGLAVRVVLLRKKAFIRALPERAIGRKKSLTRAKHGVFALNKF